MNERERAEEILRQHTVFRKFGRVDIVTRCEPIDAMLAFAAERVAAERRRCAEICRNLALPASYYDAGEQCAQAIEQEPKK